MAFTNSPVDGYWDLNKAFTTKCMDEGAVTLAAGVINCVSDLMVTLLPIPIIMRLKMPLKQRIGVTALLSVGLLVTIAGIIRTYFIWKALIDTYDETWYSYPLWICAAIEIDLAVVSTHTRGKKIRVLLTLKPSVVCMCSCPETSRSPLNDLYTHQDSQHASHEP